MRKSTKDVLINKSYILKISGTDMLAKVYERLDKINAYDAYISKYTHSKILELQKENRIKAIKAAKDKIDYLLGALGQQSGKAMEIRENENYVQNAPMASRNLLLTPFNLIVAIVFLMTLLQKSAFKKIKIRSSFFVKYEILTIQNSKQ